MENDQKKNNKKIVIKATLKIILLFLIVAGIPVYIFIFHGELITNLKSFDNVLSMMESYSKEAAVMYIVIQILQIVISILPGQVFQFAAGYMFSLPVAFVLTAIGAILGTVITYYLSKFLGKDFLYLVLGREKMEYYIKRLNSKRAYIIAFIIYLIPGLPKDIVCYGAGISSVRLDVFLVLSLIGRSFGFTGSLLIGYFYKTQSYALLIAVAIVAIVIFAICIIFRKKIMKKLDSIYEQVS